MARSMEFDPSSEAFDTIIGPAVQIEGDFSSKGNIRIEGSLKGKLETEQNLEITSTAKIEANVSSQNMVIAGTVNGDIKAEGKITILETGKVFGDITSSTLAINPGAIFSGSSNMNKQNSTQEESAEAEEQIEVEVS